MKNSYISTLDYLYSSQPAFHQVGAAAYKPGLDNTIALMAHLGNPHEAFPSVHVAGTNGKGSTSHLIAASLQAAGLRVGLYTSPHLVDFRERIRVNGEMIPEDEVVRYVEENRSFLDEIKPSFFESTMGMAFWWFRRSNVDIAVVEVGLGGRLDSTNIITPWLSVITNIGLDHTEFLGDTLEKIASEKAGIIKPGVPCVIGESCPETDPVFLRKAEECGIYNLPQPRHRRARLWGYRRSSAEKEIDNFPQPSSASRSYEPSANKEIFKFSNSQISPFWGDKLVFADRCDELRSRREQVAPECELHGAYQEKNMQTAFVALSVLSSLPQMQPLLDKSTPLAPVGWRASSECSKRARGLGKGAISYGFAHVCSLTGLRGRWEVLAEQPLTICDTGHNSHGISTYVRQLQQLHEARSGGYNASQSDNSFLRIVFGMVSDKDVDRVLDLLPREACYYWTQADSHRAIPAEEMRRMGLAHGLIGQAYDSVETALRVAREAASPRDIIFIGGSNYIVGEALQSASLHEE